MSEYVSVFSEEGGFVDDSGELENFKEVLVGEVELSISGFGVGHEDSEADAFDVLVGVFLYGGGVVVISIGFEEIEDFDGVVSDARVEYV